MPNDGQSTSRCVAGYSPQYAILPPNSHLYFISASSRLDACRTEISSIRLQTPVKILSSFRHDHEGGVVQRITHIMLLRRTVTVLDGWILVPLLDLDIPHESSNNFLGKAAIQDSSFSLPLFTPSWPSKASPYLI